MTIQAQAATRGTTRSLNAFLPIAGVTAWADAAADTLVGPGGKRGELHIALAGEWKGHPAGPFSFTGDTFDRMIERFESQKTPLSIDYDHSAPERGDSRAAGWIRKLEKRVGNDGPELWATVEWTPTAARMIADGEYRFCSAWFDLNALDRVSGENVGPELLNVGLTNVPFLDGLKPIRLSRSGAAPKSFGGTMLALDAAPEEEPAAPPAPSAEAAPPAPADPAAPPVAPPTPENDQAKMLNQQITAAVDQMCKTAGADRIAVIEMLVAMADRIGGEMRQQLERDKTPAEDRDMEDVKKKDEKEQPASDAERLAAIERDAQTNERKILLSRIDDLAKRLDERDAKDKADAQAKNEERVAGMVKSGALGEDERENALWVLSADAKKFESIYGAREGLSKRVPIGVRHAGPEQRRASVVAEVDPEKGTEADLREVDKPYLSGLLRAGVSKADAVKKTLAARAKITSEAERFGVEIN